MTILFEEIRFIFSQDQMWPIGQIFIDNWFLIQMCQAKVNQGSWFLGASATLN